MFTVVAVFPADFPDNQEFSLSLVYNWPPAVPDHTGGSDGSSTPREDPGCPPPSPCPSV